MSDKKFSEFTLQTDNSNVAFVVGFNGSDNVRISPSNLIGSGFLATSGGTMTGNLLLQDNIQLQVGTGADLKLYHNATDSFIENQTGILKIQSSVVDGDISFLADNGSGTPTEYLRLDGGDTRIKIPDNINMTFGAGGDLQLSHDATDSLIRNYTGDLKITNFADDKDINFLCDDGSGGTATYFRVDGSEVETRFLKSTLHFDNVVAKYGDSGDLQIVHNGTDTQINNTTGNLQFTQLANDKDISFASDNGSGGDAIYFFLDGSQATGGGTLFTKWGDNSYISLGDGSDLYFFHNGTDTKMQNITGDLVFEQTADDKDIIFQSDDGSGGTAEYFRLDGGLASGGELKTLFPDNSRIVFGDGADFNFYHDGTDSRIQNTTGHIRIINFADDSDIIFSSDDGSGGTTEYFRVDGSDENVLFSKILKLSDNVELRIGGGNDIKIYHDTSNSYIKTGTDGGNLTIEQNKDDADIIFKSDDGSGGTTEYFKLDGSETNTLFSKSARFIDSIPVQLGTDADLTIQHDNTDGKIDNFTGDLKIRNFADDGNISFLTDDGSGGTTEYFRIDGQYELNRFVKNARFIDDVKANFGTTDDLQIYHSSGSNIIDATVGDLIIKTSQDDGDIIFKSDDGSGGVETYFFLDGSKADGTGNLYTNFPDKSHLTFGDKPNGDLRIFHDGSNSRINEVGTGNLIIQATNYQLLKDDGGEFIMQGIADAEVSLYYNGSKKFETTNTGVDVTGRMAINDGNDNLLFGDYAGDALTTGTSNIAIGTNALSAEDTGTRSVAIGEGALQLQNNDNSNYNIAIGHHAGNLITTGAYNTIMGGLAGDALTTGAGNVAIGYLALSTEDAGGTNTAVGHSALKNQDAGDVYNTVVGYHAGEAITSGGFNTIVGGDAGDALTTGNRNVAIGYEALSTEDTGARNVAIGEGSLRLLNYDGNGYNVAIGYDAGTTLSTGTQNTLIGALSGDALTTGQYNVALGTYALSSEDTGSGNVAIGREALENQNYDGSAYNTSVGYQSGKYITTGIVNTIIGGLAADALTTGSENVALGYKALSTEDTGSHNIAIGSGALENLNYDGSGHNTAVGHNSGNDLTTGINNTLIGALSGDALTTGGGNTALGYKALSAEDTLDGNTAIGYESLKVQDGGSFNTSIGYQSGVAVSTGDENTFLGAKAGDAVTTGTNLTIIGYNAAASAVGAADEITLGDANVDTLRCATQTISALSDERDKSNIQESTYGLDFIDQLNPVTFDWNTRDGSRKGKKDLGFIAQELDAVDDEYTQLVYKSNPDKLEASYGRLVPVLVKAIQELKQEIQELKNK